MDNRQHDPHHPSSEQSTSGEYRYLMDLLRACGGQSHPPCAPTPSEPPKSASSQTILAPTEPQHP